MAYYAQKNYSQILGFGPDTIAAAGCLLDAICNLLQRNGITTDPVTLNEWFKAHGAFIDGDLLAWTSITQFAPEMHVASPVTDSPMPSSDNAIVQFHYQSVQHPWLANGQPNMIDHYCAVDRIENGQLFIVDSWDGLVKGPTAYEATYHKPVCWVTYQKSAPAPAAPPTPPAAPVVAPNLSDTYAVLKPLDGFINASFAAAHQQSNSTVPPGKYYVYRRYTGMVNITRIAGQPGWWINPEDNVMGAPAAPSAPAPVQPPVPAPAPAPVAPAVLTPPNWKASYKPLRQDYFSLKTLVIHDLDTRRPDVILNQYDLVHGAGVFTGPDGNDYVRTVDSVKSFAWYGLPVAVLLSEAKAMPAIHKLTNNMSFRDYLKISLSHLAGWFEDTFAKK
jgi:hypothetical protein